MHSLLHWITLTIELSQPPISCLTSSSLHTISSGIPRKIPRVSCIFSVNSRVFNLYIALEEFLENTETFKVNATNAQRTTGRLGLIRLQVYATVSRILTWCIFYRMAKIAFFMTAITSRIVAMLFLLLMFVTTWCYPKVI